MDILFVIIVLFAVLYFLLILYYWYGWNSIPVFNNDNNVAGHTKVTVIIPARNEANNIADCLKALSKQYYPKTLTEIIVVNDFSTDGTANIVSDFPAENIRVINLEEHLSKHERLVAYKKKAIALAISESQGDLIFTTDADCVMGPEWISTIVQFYEKESVKFIAAPVTFHREDNFFKYFQSLDFISMQGITGAAVHLSKGTMCNGANLAYEKTAFEGVGGFTGIDCIASGDDMLLMYKMYRAYPGEIRFLKDPKAIVRTLPMSTMKDFMNQRIRWASKADKFEDKRLTIILAFVYCWNVILFGLGVAGFFNHVFWWWLLVLFVLKVAIESIYLLPVLSFFGKTRMWWYFIPSQVLHIPYILIAGWLGKFGSYQWKGRELK